MNNRDGYGKLFLNSGEYFVGLYKNDIRYGPGVLRYATGEEDVGYWSGDKLIRLLVPVEATFVYNDLDPVEKTIEIKAWYDRENLLRETLNPQNLFLNTIVNSRALNFIKNDPYMDKVLEQKKLIHEHYINVLEKWLSESILDLEPITFDEFLKEKSVDVENLTPCLTEIFKHFRQFSCFNKNFSSILNVDLSAFENCNFLFFFNSA
jgi:hypothetical protein